MDVKRDDDGTMISSRLIRGSTCCCHQRLPQLHSKGLKGRDVWRRTLILFVVAMVAGGNNGMPQQQMEVIMVWWQVAIKRC